MSPFFNAISTPLFHPLVRIGLLLTLLLTALTPLPVQAQSGQIRFEHLTIDDGLSQSTITAIVQDTTGYLWFGTEEGLNRYDGLGFEIFKHDPQNENSLQSNIVSTLYIDEQGDLWIGSPAGLDRYHSEENRFEHFPFVDVGRSGLWGRNVEVILQVAPGLYWIGTQEGGLNLLDINRGIVEHFLPIPNDPQSMLSKNVYDLVGDGKGGIWVATDNGLSHFNPLDRLFTHYRHSRINPLSISDSRLTSLFIDSRGDLWIGTNRGGLNRLVSATGRFERFVSDPEEPASLRSNQVFDIHEDEEGTLWIATRQGISLLDRTSGHFTHLRKDRNDPQSLNNEIVTVLYTDRAGVMWVGTFGGGVNRYARHAHKFSVYDQKPGDLLGLSDSNVFAVTTTPDGALWIGTLSGGLNRLERDFDRMRYYYHLISNPVGIASNEVRSLYSDRAGNLWIGTGNAGLDRFDAQKNTFVHYQIDPQNPNISAQYFVTTIMEDSQSRLWVGTRGYGFHRFDPSTQSFQHFSLPGQTNAAQLVRAICEDGDGLLWIATYEGVFVFNPQTGEFPSHYWAESATDPLSSNTIMSLYLPDADTVWIGTWSGGLNHLNRTTGHITVYTEKDGLANDTIYAILPDANGNLWLSTNRGLTRFNPRTGAFRNYDTSDGLSSNEFNAGAAYISPQGEFFFGTINGLVSFYPDRVTDNPVPPPVVVRSFSLYNKPQQRNLRGGERIEISYRDTLISFEFAALDYTAPQKNQFAYKLEGFDKDWNYTGNRNFVTYTNLRGGDYTLRVKAANNDGVWNDTGIAIVLHVSPPFYTRWWFISLGVAGVLAVVFTGYRLRLRRIENQKRDLEKLVHERTQEIERRRQVAEGMRDIIAILNTNQSLQNSLDYIIHQAVQLVHARHAVIFYHPPDAVPQEMAGELPQNLLAYRWLVESILTGQMVVIEDADAYRQRLDAQPLPGDRGAVLGIPIASGEQVDGGLILTFSRSGRLPEEDFKTALTLADQAALAIANANLRQQAEELAKTTERSRLARDLHDAVTQTLFASTLIADVLPRLWQRNPEEGLRRLDELRLLTRGALAEMRSLLVELRPGALLDANLSELIQQLCDAFVSRTRLQVNCDIQTVEKQPPEVQIAFYRIAQEALNNIARHARPKQVAVFLRNEQGAISLRISDDGKGFDPEAVPPAHFGLEIMRERAQSIGAQLSIESQPGQGVTIQLVYPY